MKWDQYDQSLSWGEKISLQAMQQVTENRRFFMWQILRQYLTKECHVRKFEGPILLKILRILQTEVATMTKLPVHIQLIWPQVQNTYTKIFSENLKSFMSWGSGFLTLPPTLPCCSIGMDLKHHDAVKKKQRANYWNSASLVSIPMESFLLTASSCFRYLMLKYFHRNLTGFSAQ